MDYLRRALPGSEALRRAEGLLEQLQSQATMDDTDGNEHFKHIVLCSIVFLLLLFCGRFSCELNNVFGYF